MARVKLTDKYVKSIKTPALGRREISDAICPGLYLRLSAGGAKSFAVLVRRGALVRKTLGRYPVLGLAEARQAAMQFMRELEAAPIATPQPTRAGMTLEQLITSYLDLYLTPNGVKSWQNIVACLKQEAMQHLHLLHADDIGKSDIVAVLDNLVAAGKPHAAANLLKAARPMFTWAAGRGEIDSNPCDGLRPPIRQTSRDRVLTDQEIAKVWLACDQVPEPFGAIVRMLLLTGARRNEIAQMRWAELDGDVWVLPANRSKSGRANALPLPPAAMAIVRSMRDNEGGEFVFSTTSGKRPSSDFSKRKRLLDEASGTSGWVLHDLRRSARSRLSQIGVAWEVARRVVGHSVDAVDQIYDQHSYRQEKREALSRLADHITSIVAAQR